MTEGHLSERARDRLTELERNIQRPIKEPRREITPERDLSPLSGEDVFKLRIGDSRVIIGWNRTNNTVYVLSFGYRRNIYDREW